MFFSQTNTAMFYHFTVDVSLQTVILRSSQPLTGANNKRCREDEKLVNAILGMGKRGYIIDTRSQTAAATAKSKGKFV